MEINVQNIMNEINEWQNITFNNGIKDKFRSIPMSYHLMEESKELNQELESYLGSDVTLESLSALKEEIADNFILLFGISTNLDFSFNDIIEMITLKMDKNKTREWGIADNNGIVKHLKNNKTCL